MYLAKDKEKYIKNATELLIREGSRRLFNGNVLQNGDDDELHNLINSLQVNGRGTGFDVDRSIEMEEEILGKYTPMSSPGKITLYMDELIVFFRDIIMDLIESGFYFSLDDYKGMAEITILKTFYHEYFHHYADIQLQLYKFSKIKEVEEALAVAWSRLKVNEFILNKKYKSSTPIYEAYLRKIYNYSLPGYRDWKKYVSKEDFCLKAIDYILPTSSIKLLKNGVNMTGMIYEGLNYTYNTSNAVLLDFEPYDILNYY